MDKSENYPETLFLRLQEDWDTYPREAVFGNFFLFSPSFLLLFLLLEKNLFYYLFLKFFYLDDDGEDAPAGFLWPRCFLVWIFFQLVKRM